MSSPNGESIPIIIARVSEAPTSERKTYYMQEVLDCFGRIRSGGKSYYTCNVSKLRECDRFGEPEEIEKWFSVAFMKITERDRMHGIIFSDKPGSMVFEQAKERVGRVYLAVNSEVMVNIAEDERLPLPRGLKYMMQEAPQSKRSF